MNRQDKNLLLALLAIDLAFIGAHVAGFFFPDLHYYRMRLTVDGGFPEQFQYIKLLSLAVILGTLAMDRLWASAGIWSLIFIGIFVDDAAQIHEAVGAASPLGQDLGELAFFVLAGIVIVPLALGAYRSDTVNGRRLSWDMARFMGLLALCGGGVDLLHSALGNTSVLGHLAGVAEDGGEMVVVTYALTNAVQWFRVWSLTPEERGVAHG